MYGIQKWQKDTFLMKNSTSNQWLYFLSSFLLLSRPFSSIPAFVSLFFLLTYSFFKNFLLDFSLFTILLCLLILFTHLPCTTSSILCVLYTDGGLQHVIQQQNALLSWRGIVDTSLHFLCSTLWISFSLFVLFVFLAPWCFVLSLLIPCKFHLTWFGAFISRLVKLLAHACTI